MELHAANVVVPDHRRVCDAVIRLTDDHLNIARFAVIRMHEIEKSLIGNPAKQRVCCSLTNLVPAQLRHHQIPRKATHSPPKKLKPAVVPNSSDSSKSICMPTQTPSRGVPSL